MTSQKINETLAIIGYPNCGKTTIFNFFAKKVARVGNWEGVTVNANFASMSGAKSKKQTIVDLPGIKSLDHYMQQLSCNAPCYGKKQCTMCPSGKNMRPNGDYSRCYTQELCQKDELESFNFLLSNNINAILNVVDATKLHRDLRLTVQLIELGLPLVVIVNKIDLAQAKGILINFKLLEKKLCCKVIPINAKKKTSLAALKEILQNNKLEPYSKKDFDPSVYSENIKKLDKKIKTVTQNRMTLFKAILIDKTNTVQKNLQKTTSDDFCKVLDSLHRLNKEINATTDTSISSIMMLTLSDYAQQTYRASINERKDAHSKRSISKALDNVLLNKWLSIPILMIILQLMFFITIRVGGYLQEIFGDGIQMLIALYIRPFFQNLFSGQEPIFLTIFDGVMSGVKILASFMPIIWILYFLLAIFEDSGYMTRAVAALDGIFKRIGISGKAIISLVLSFGCNVPAILSTRTIRTIKQRIITIFIVPFIPCSARLTVFTVFCSIFFLQEHIYLIMIFYLCGCAVSIGAGYMLHNCLYNNEVDVQSIDNPIIHHAELPDYNIPNLRYVFGAATYKMKEFARNIWGVVLIISVIINMLSIIDINGNVDQDKSTIIRSLSSKTTPALNSIGVTDSNWQAATALISGIFAKEILIITLSNLYNLENEQTSSKLSHAQTKKLKKWQDTMKLHFENDANVVSYLLFILFYFPCVAVFAAIKNEVGYKCAILSAIFQTLCAYVCAAIFHKLSLITRTLNMGWMMISNIVVSVMMLLVIFEILVLTNNALYKIKYKLLSKNRPISST